MLTSVNRILINIGKPGRRQTFSIVPANFSLLAKSPVASIDASSHKANHILLPTSTKIWNRTHKYYLFYLRIDLDFFLRIKRSGSWSTESAINGRRLWSPTEYWNMHVVFHYSDLLKFICVANSIGSLFFLGGRRDFYLMITCFTMACND